MFKVLILRRKWGYSMFRTQIILSHMALIIFQRYLQAPPAELWPGGQEQDFRNTKGTNPSPLQPLSRLWPDKKSSQFKFWSHEILICCEQFYCIYKNPWHILFHSHTVKNRKINIFFPLKCMFVRLKRLDWIKMESCVGGKHFGWCLFVNNWW